jgi:Flp pilus assembly pilin Flp
VKGGPHLATLRRVFRWASSEGGATTAEYALILTLVVIMLISSLSSLGVALQTKLRAIIEQINAAQ